MQKKRAIVTGVTGQDGYYMAELLLKKGYEVYGTIRHNQDKGKTNSDFSKVILCPIDLLNKSEVKALVEFTKPDEIYNFAAVSNVFDPWKDMDQTFDINIKIPTYILEAINSRSPETKFLQASSSLVFGRGESGPKNEFTPRDPIYPYGVSKNMVDNLIKEARLTFGTKACSAIFFNHESPRRGDSFFSKKIAKAAVDIKNGVLHSIPVGKITTYRDYGYAQDYMEAAFLMLRRVNPTDYIIGTGNLIMMCDYIQKCFDYVGLNYDNHVYVDNELYRDNDTSTLKADISKIKHDLGWEPKTNIDGLVEVMMESALRSV